MHIDTTFPPGARVGAFLAVADYLDAAELGAAIDALIERLDAAAADPDIEANGDELDGDWSEDDFIRHGGDRGAGCPIADSDRCEASDDDPERQCGDSQPGDSDDAEDNGDTELNGDETDHDVEPNA